ncbi:hypothetical protein Adt_04261 [Abeliophyllum distichum]|uniref:Uncharacterized protein n=1 Tax=Abeliophyllum distichum TaxID=126358 RepID=A0ABD1W0U6_9LAMI
MGSQAVKKYFTPKWEEFSSHGELEDVLEASLASAIRASAMQMKVLDEFRTRMQEQRKLVAQASKADKEHKQALEGLQAALDSARTAYEQMEVDLKESDSNLLNMTKQLDNGNVAQKVAAEALEAANKEKRSLLEEAKSRDEEISGLRKNLELSENVKKETSRKKGSGSEIGQCRGKFRGKLPQYRSLFFTRSLMRKVLFFTFLLKYLDIFLW